MKLTVYEATKRYLEEYEKNRIIIENKIDVDCYINDEKKPIPLRHGDIIGLTIYVNDKDGNKIEDKECCIDMMIKTKGRKKEE